MAKKKSKKKDFSIQLTVASDKSDVALPSEFTISPNFDVDEVTGDDPSDDKFIYAYTESGVSKNERDWTPEVISSLGEQVLEKLPVGHLGHIKSEDAGFVLPEPQITWFGIHKEDLEDGQVRMWFKGYVLPTAEKLKTWIKAKAVNSISIWGKVQYVDGEDNIMKIQAVDLKSIDVSRKLGEGLPAHIVGLAGEMSKEDERKVVTVEDAGEMDGSFEDIRNSIHKQLSVYRDGIRKELDTKFKAGEITEAEAYSPWLYVHKTFADHLLIGEEETNRLFKVPYTIEENEVKVKFDEQIEVKIVYEEVKADEGNEEDDESKGEQTLGEQSACGGKKKKKKKSTKGESEEVDEEEVDDEEDEESKKKKKKKKATKGEMDDEPKAILGEMAKIFGMSAYVGEQEGDGNNVPTVEDVIAEAKSIVKEKDALKEQVEEVSEILQVSEGEDIKAKAKELSDAQRISNNEVQITNVTNAFEDLTKDVTDEVLKEYLRDDFAHILDAKAEDINDDKWSEGAIAELQEQLPNKLEKHTKRLSKIATNSQMVGEMSSIANLGNGMGFSNGATKKNFNEMDPKEAAESLGY